MSTNPIVRKLRVTDPLESYAKRAMHNHMVLYNQGVLMMDNNPSLTYKELKYKINQIVIEQDITDRFSNALYTDIRYLYKQHTKGNSKRKSFKDIYYLTFNINSLDNKTFTIEDNLIIFNGIDGHMEILGDSIPTDLIDGKNSFFNISYSAREQSWELNISVL